LGAAVHKQIQFKACCGRLQLLARQCKKYKYQVKLKTHKTRLQKNRSLKKSNLANACQSLAKNATKKYRK
jgi:hypothetical protein